MWGNAEEWASELLGGCELGDARRTKRLVDIGARMAYQVGDSLAKSCNRDTAALLGSYRLMRNEAVKPGAILEGAFAKVASQAQGHEALLAIEDTTSISYQHAAAAELGMTGSPKGAKRRGFLVHSVLLVDAISEASVGLIEQERWCRKEEDHGKKHARKHRPYEEKESYKWEHASVRMAARLGDTMSRTISVCDRESDLYDYLHYKSQHGQRFIVRGKTDRALLGSKSRCEADSLRLPESRCEADCGSGEAESPRKSEFRWFGTLERAASELCCYRVAVLQRGGRKAREAKLTLHSMRVELLAPAGNGAKHSPLSVNVVLAQEHHVTAGVEPLRWILLTTEPVTEAEEALKVVRYYELRWRIEEYHKAWKSGVGVERQRFQSKENLERMLAITALLAVRLLQLRESGCKADCGSDEVESLRPHKGAPTPETSCDKVLSEEEWKVLWITTEKKAPPEAIPSARWAYYAIAKLGGFADTKRTGRPGWDTIWSGWFRLQERMEGYRLGIAAAKM